ncbi:hypothetical protein C8R47DRAFT_600444 [Mycena vitilis]|nr:hypothetical protein C8R47DRAFT_600444 [Mycena vitilis]
MGRADSNRPRLRRPQEIGRPPRHAAAAPRLQDHLRASPTPTECSTRTGYAGVLLPSSRVFLSFPSIPDLRPILLMIMFVSRLARVPVFAVLFAFDADVLYGACGLYGCDLCGYDSYVRCPMAPAACVAAQLGARHTIGVHDACAFFGAGTASVDAACMSGPPRRAVTGTVHSPGACYHGCAQRQQTLLCAGKVCAVLFSWRGFCSLAIVAHPLSSSLPFRNSPAPCE